MTLDSKILNQIKKFLKCNINFYKDFKLFNLKNKHVKMLDINKLPQKISDICSIIRFNRQKKRKQK